MRLFCEAKTIAPSLVRRLCLASIATLLVACSASTEYQTRPFFQTERNVEHHGRKHWFDHLVEVDPGRAGVEVAEEYNRHPPERIAVLPFVDLGSAQYVVDKIPLSFRNKEERQEWAWTYSNRLRKSITGELAQREFLIIPIPAIDAVLQDHGINDWQKLQAVSPQDLGQWLGADTVIYGDVLHYDAYYALLIAAWQVGVDIKMVSTRDGHAIFNASDSRYAVDLRPALDVMDIAINSALSLLQLRDITLARAEDEVAREIVLRIPVSYTAIANLQSAARQQAAENSTSNGYVKLGSPQGHMIFPGQSYAQGYRRVGAAQSPTAN